MFVYMNDPIISMYHLQKHTNQEHYYWEIFGAKEINHLKLGRLNQKQGKSY